MSGLKTKGYTFRSSKFKIHFYPLYLLHQLHQPYKPSNFTNFKKPYKLHYMANINKKGNNSKSNRAPLFRTMNYVLMGVGLVLLIAGYLALRGGAVEDPNIFDGEIFNNTRIVVAPVLMFLGLATEIVAIMWHPRAKKQVEDDKTE